MSKHRKRLPANTETNRETQKFNLTVERDRTLLEQALKLPPRPFVTGVFDETPPKSTLDALTRYKQKTPE